MTLTLRAGVPQVVRYRASGVPPAVPIDLPAPDTGKGWYMVARGHNVDPPFLSGWLAQGGEAVIGDPLTEAFSYQGLPTQYFDTLALRIGPHGLTTAPLGLVALGKAYPRAKEFPKRKTHYYDHTTGHNIHGGFLKFWRAHGGLSFFGDPLTEELRIHGQTVQYFTGAEFVVDHSVPGGIALLPLGQRMWPTVRKVYGL